MVSARVNRGSPSITDGTDGHVPAGGDVQGDLALEVRGLVRSFGPKKALSGVSLEVRRGEIHALLGPNGAGKTTLLRVLAGLVDPHEGEIRVLGHSLPDLPYRTRRRLFGVVPSGDRSFYLRLSGLENLAFFARLHGLRRARAVERSWECLRAVGLEDAARGWVGNYSHGMQKRLSVARALLMRPAVLLIDEATHDLDPEGARRVRDLIVESTERGAGVVWATQRIDEIRGLADRVTVLDKGQVRFSGSVPALMAISPARRYLLHLGNGSTGRHPVLDDARAALAAWAGVLIDIGPEDEHFVLGLPDDITLGQALAALVNGGVDVIACREDRSEIEEAFLKLTGDSGP